jgi:hypothetical protein
MTDCSEAASTFQLAGMSVVALGFSLYVFYCESTLKTSQTVRRTRLFQSAVGFAMVSSAVSCFTLWAQGALFGSLAFSEKAVATMDCLGMVCSVCGVVLGFFGTGLRGPLVVASSGISCTVWFVCFAAYMIRFM